MPRPRRLLPLFMALAAASCRPPPAAPARAGARTPVVLVSIDGLRPDYVLRADELGLAIPNLRRMAAEGSFAEGVRGVLPTVTYPAHTTMVTGVSPARHGIYANTAFDPDERNQNGWHWYAEDIRAPTLWGATSAAGLASASVFWPVNVGAKATYVVAEVWRADTPDDRKLTRALSTPGLVAELEGSLGPLPGGRDWGVEADEARARFAARLLASKRPAFLALHLLALDTEQHARGPFERPVFDALERLDAAVGRLRAAAEAAGGGRAVMCVVSDHGFAEVDTEVNLKAALREAGLVEIDERGKVVSWRASAWVAGATAAVVLRDPGDGDAALRVDEVVRRLSEGPDAVVARALGAKEIAALGGFPTASVVVELRPRHYFGPSWQGPVVVRRGPSGGAGYRGMHGYLPDRPAMNAALFLAGPGVPKGRSLGTVDLRDVAPTLAALLGVGLPSAEGRDLLRARGLR